MPRVASGLAAFARRTPRAFDQALTEVSPVARRVDTARHWHSGSVDPYRTVEGICWRFVYRRSDRTPTTKRGVNNALGTLVVCLNAAVDDGLLAVKPALRIERRPRPVRTHS
jgi:hypothetical protein